MSFRDYIPSTRNTIALFCGFAVTAGVWWWWKSQPKRPSPKDAVAEVGEFDRISYAVRNARSWRATTAGTIHGEPFQTDQDVVCLFSSHTVTHTTSASGVTSVADEFIETKDSFYAHEGSDPWVSEPRAGTDKCAQGPMAGPSPLISTLDTLRASTVLRPGPSIQFPGGTCRVWDFVAKEGLGATRGSICVDELSHLPYELRVGGLRVDYSNWNMPIPIEPPVLPAATGSQQP